MEELNQVVPEDLEDGEIESDNEAPPEPNQSESPVEPAAIPPEPETVIEPRPLKKSEGKKKKSKKDKNKEEKNKDKHKKYGNHPSPIEDDFAGNIEKAIRMAMKKGDDEHDAHIVMDDTEGRRKHKKRKKHEHDNSSKKKRKRTEELSATPDEMDEDEMMCVRGASPVHKQRPHSPYEAYHSDEHDSYASDTSVTSRGHHNRTPRHRAQRDRKNKNMRDRRRDAHPNQDPDGICLFFMQGKCHKGDDCAYSHDAQPPRKMELCKFYLMDCCAKRDKCLYMHSDFPCKYYHTGLPCIFKDECKFAHGQPLTEALKLILLKHIESAPKEILGDFPRLSRDGAAMMVANTQMRLMQQFSPTSADGKDKNIPSLFELNIPKPMGYEDAQNIPQLEHFVNSNEKHQNKNMSQKVRQSRWCDSGNMPPVLNNMVGLNAVASHNVLSIQNLTGVLTSKQINDLLSLGIENLNQLSQLTVNQLNQLGLTLRQINEIQLNTMSIQKLGLIKNDAPTSTQMPMNNFLNNMVGSKDLDMRVAPPAPPLGANSPKVTQDLPGQDVDMRFQSSITPAPEEPSEKPSSKVSNDPRRNKESIDIDQYTKDAFSTTEKENISKASNENLDFKTPDSEAPKVKDVDHRVLQYVRDATSVNLHKSEEETKHEADIDIRIPPKRIQESQIKKPDKRIRRSTTDDEEDNLLIDERWYSSDEERSDKHNKNNLSPSKPAQRPDTPPTLPPVIEPNAVLTKLGDLSKIDISAEVTRLLTSMKNNSSESSDNIPSVVNNEQLKPRDPRSLPKKSPEHRSSSTDSVKSTVKKQRVSIYTCVEGEPTDGRRRSDVDLRLKKDQDFRLPAFGDTDLRQTPGSGDIDLRMSLPFKPLPNYTPATEIDGSITSHPPIVFKVHTVHIPRPDYTDIRNGTAKSQALLDPRLRKIFRLSIEEPSTSDSEKTVKPTTRADPRRKPKDTIENVEPPIQNPLDLQVIIQNSSWYKELSTNQKIFVNQQLATVTSSLKKFHQEKIPGKLFDVNQIHSSPILCSIFNSLGISLDERGEFSYIKNQENPLLNNPMNFMQNTDNFGPGNMNNMGGPMDGNMGMMGVNQMPVGNMGPMGNMQMGSMGNMNFNPQFAGNDPRNAPGLLGMAPNMPHNFDNSNFGGMNNFGSDPGYGGNNMQFNGPGNGMNMNDYEFNNMDSNESNFMPNRNQGRNNFRGTRNNDRWNRGSRGNRERRNFGDRGGWKSDRRNNSN